MSTGKKKKINKQQEQQEQKICVTWLLTIGDCELRSLLILNNMNGGEQLFHPGLAEVFLTQDLDTSHNNWKQGPSPQCTLGWSNESSYTATMYFFPYHSGQS